MEDHSPSHDMPFSSPSLGMYTAISPSTGHSICIHLLTLSLADTHRHPCGLSQQTIQVDNIPSTSSIVLASSHPLTKSPSHQVTKSPSHQVTKSPTHQVAHSPSHERTCACSHAAHHRRQVHNPSPLSQLVLARTHPPLHHPSPYCSVDT